MNNSSILIEEYHHTTNCGIKELSGFVVNYDGWWIGKIPKVLTNKDYLTALSAVLRSDGDFLFSDGRELSAIFIFSENDLQAASLSEYSKLKVLDRYSDLRGHFTPGVFAKWLKKQGEKVHTTAWVKNPNSGNSIRVYTWVVSNKFRNKYNKFVGNNKKNEATGRGAREA
jgi:hypothetical protein